MMERGEALKLDLSPGDNGPSTHFNSGQSLLERIDRFLGKKKERSAPHGMKLLLLIMMFPRAQCVHPSFIDIRCRLR